MLNNSHTNLLAFVETKNSNLEGEKYSIIDIVGLSVGAN